MHYRMILNINSGHRLLVNFLGVLIFFFKLFFFFLSYDNVWGVRYEYNKKKIKLFLFGGKKKKKTSLLHISLSSPELCAEDTEARKPWFWLPVSPVLTQ